MIKKNKKRFIGVRTHTDFTQLRSNLVAAEEVINLNQLIFISAPPFRGKGDTDSEQKS